MIQMRGKKILIVEDDTDLREIIADAFSIYGAVTQTAVGGEQAYELVQKDRFDVVISDIQMPKGDGIELMKKITQGPQPKPLCFLFTGQFGRTDLSLKSLEVVKVFEKPFKTKEMIEEIGKHLAKFANL